MRSLLQDLRYAGRLLVHSPGFTLLTVATLALVLGTLGALALRKVLASLLFAVAPTDPLIFGLVLVLLALVSLLACWWPARRAARVDPLVALRYE